MNKVTDAQRPRKVGDPLLFLICCPPLALILPALTADGGTCTRKGKKRLVSDADGDNIQQRDDGRESTEHAGWRRSRGRRGEGEGGPSYRVVQLPLGNLNESRGYPLTRKYVEGKFRFFTLINVIPDVALPGTLIGHSRPPQPPPPPALRESRAKRTMRFLFFPHNLVFYTYVSLVHTRRMS